MKETYHCQSPIGWIKIVGSSEGLESVSINLPKEESRELAAEIPPVLQDCVQQLKEYFAEERTEFDLKLDWSKATNFEKQVWGALLTIPYGKTASYSDIANKIENPKAVRAVGKANGNNPIPIIVPCHRIIGKNGSMTGFASGIEMKERLLRLEKVNLPGKQGRLF